jgi:DNA primase
VDGDPSFTVSPERGTFRCWGAGCRVSGDVFQFIRLIRHVSFKAALEELAHRGRIPVHPFVQAEVNAVIREQDILDVTELVARTYHAALTPEIRAYVTERRSLPAEFITQYVMGFADGQAGVHAVYRRYGDQGLQVMQAAGLARFRYDSMPGEIGYRDTFVDRLLVSTTHLGRVTFLSGRALRPDQQPKYYHQPGREAPLFDEDNVDPDMTLVTEGVFDALSLKAWNYPATACYGGVRASALAKLLGIKTVVACFDGDPPGRAATVKLAMALGAKLRVIRLPDGFDPNDFYRQHSQEEFERLRQHASDPIDFMLATIDPSWSTPRIIQALDPVLAYLATLTPVEAESCLNLVVKDRFTFSRRITTLLREDVDHLREHGRGQCPKCWAVLHAR